MAARWRFPRPRRSMFEVKMKRNQHYREQIQTRQIPVSFQCNLCLRIFSANHGKNIHLNSCRKRSSPAESTARVRSFQHIKLKWMSVSQQGANHHQHNVKYGETILKMISAIKSMRYMNKSYLETEFIQITEWTRGPKIYLWHNKEDRVLEPRCHRV